MITGGAGRGGPAAFGWAFANAALFSAYIALAHRVARADPEVSPIDRLGAAMLVAAVVITPIGLGSALPAFVDPVALGAGLGVGVTSSVIPYVCDQLAMTRLSRATYSLFVALLPAVAVLIGMIVLRQFPLPLESVGVGVLLTGLIAHREPDDAPAQPTSPDGPRVTA